MEIRSGFIRGAVTISQKNSRPLPKPYQELNRPLSFWTARRLRWTNRASHHFKYTHHLPAVNQKANSKIVNGEWIYEKLARWCIDRRPLPAVWPNRRTLPQI